MRCSQAYKLDIANGDYIGLYTDFLLNTGIGNDDRDCGVDANDFVGGNFLLVFDRSKHKCNRYHRHPFDSGTIDINIRTRQNLPSTINVMVYATYSSEIVIDDAYAVTVTNTF